MSDPEPNQMFYTAVEGLMGQYRTGGQTYGPAIYVYYKGAFLGFLKKDLKGGFWFISPKSYNQHVGQIIDIQPNNETIEQIIESLFWSKF